MDARVGGGDASPAGPRRHSPPENKNDAEFEVLHGPAWAREQEQARLLLLLYNMHRLAKVIVCDFTREARPYLP